MRCVLVLVLVFCNGYRQDRLHDDDDDDDDDEVLKLSRRQNSVKS